MPGEWEKHSAVWLAWPYDEITFPDGRLKKTEQAYVQIIKHLHTDEDISLLVLNEKMQDSVKAQLLEVGVDLSKISFYQTDYADVWIRDYGPTFIINPQSKELAWIKWGYNAYGNKFPDLLKDNEVFFNLRKNIDRRMFEPGIFMEGGAIETNGSGIVLTTEQCLLNTNRNPDLNKTETEKYLRNFLGAKKIIWLKQGIANDHTDGHIDELVRFVNSKTIVCAYEEDLKDPNYQILEENYQTLKTAADAEGQAFRITKLPMPHLTYDDGQRAPASYTNFFIGNKTVLAPTFNDPNDQKALEMLGALFPDKKIIGIDCTNLIYGGGAIHCITQQTPA